MQVLNKKLVVTTAQGIHLFDITDQINELISQNNINSGLISVSSMHTTMAITVNENESRLLVDIKNFFNELVPANKHYLHNDIQMRDCPPDEPENAHSHLIAMMLGNSESIPVVDGKLDIGQYQSVILVELDGPRQRTINVHIIAG